MMPGLTGMRVIDAKNGAEQLIGELFPWHQIRIQTTNGSAMIHILNERCKPIKRNKKIVQVKAKGSAKLLGRLQDRAMRKWATESDEPITFEPVEELWRWWWVSFVFALGSGLYISIGSLQLFWPALQTPQPIVLLAIVGFILASAQLAAIAFPLLLWILRPRQQSFISVDLMPTGIVGATPAGEVIILIFEDLKKCKIGSINHGRCRMQTLDGQTYWMAIQSRPIKTYVASAIASEVLSPKEIMEQTIRAMYRQGARLIVLGIISGVATYTFMGYLLSTGLLPPSFTKQQQWGTTMFAAVLPVMIGLILIWTGWSNSIKGRRSIKRFKARFARNKQPAPTNTTA